MNMLSKIVKRARLLIVLTYYYFFGAHVLLAQSVSQFDSEPLLKQARANFETNYVEGGEKLLNQYIREKKQAFPSGYTFGLEAATVASENLNTDTAIEVINDLKNHCSHPEDLMLQEGIEAALLNVYSKAHRWSDGMKLIEEIQRIPKTNFILNMAVFDFNRALLSSGEIIKAALVSKTFIGDGSEMNDTVMPVGFWMQQAAETAFLLNQPSNGLQTLTRISQVSPDYYQSNKISILMEMVTALERLNKPSEVAEQLATAYNASQKGYPVTAADQDLLQNRLKTYQRAGWLDDNYKANPVQVSKPLPGPRLDSLSKNHIVLIRTIMFIVFLLSPCLIFFFAFKKRQSK